MSRRPHKPKWEAILNAPHYNRWDIMTPRGHGIVREIIHSPYTGTSDNDYEYSIYFKNGKSRKRVQCASASHGMEIIEKLLKLRE